MGAAGAQYALGKVEAGKKLDRNESRNMAQTGLEPLAANVSALFPFWLTPLMRVERSREAVGRSETHPTFRGVRFQCARLPERASNWPTSPWLRLNGG